MKVTAALRRGHSHIIVGIGVETVKNYYHHRCFQAFFLSCAATGIQENSADIYPKALCGNCFNLSDQMADPLEIQHDEGLSCCCNPPVLHSDHSNVPMPNVLSSPGRV